MMDKDDDEEEMERLRRRLKITMPKLMASEKRVCNLEFENMRLREDLQAIRGEGRVEADRVASNEEELRRTIEGLERQIQDCNEVCAIQDGKLQTANDMYQVSIHLLDVKIKSHV
jgi:hypothetical protein